MSKVEELLFYAIHVRGGMAKKCEITSRECITILEHLRRDIIQFMAKASEHRKQPECVYAMLVVGNVRGKGRKLCSGLAVFH